MNTVRKFSKAVCVLIILKMHENTYSLILLKEKKNSRARAQYINNNASLEKKKNDVEAVTR